MHLLSLLVGFSLFILSFFSNKSLADFWNYSPSEISNDIRKGVIKRQAKEESFRIKREAKKISEELILISQKILVTEDSSLILSYLKKLQEGHELIVSMIEESREECIDNIQRAISINSSHTDFNQEDLEEELEVCRDEFEKPFTLGELRGNLSKAIYFFEEGSCYKPGGFLLLKKKPFKCDFNFVKENYLNPIYRNSQNIKEELL